MLNPMEELTESFHKGADKIFELAQLLQLSLDKIQLIIAKLSDRDSKVKLYEDECDIIQDQLRTYDESFAAAKNCITTYAKKLDTVLSVLTPTIRWLPEQQKMMEMVYQDGTSPWKFTLIHNNSSIETINALLEENFSKGMLQQVTSLSAGDFVCCYERKLLYRASVLGIMPGGRVRVINVDNTSLKIVKKENIFDLTVDLLDIPAQAVQCTLLPQDNEDEKVWSEELNSIFKSTLVECKLTINVLERIETLPPKFVVELYGFNESLEVETNLSDWICKRMLPEVKTLSKNNNNKDDVLGFLKEETVDPYFLTADESQCGLTNGFADLSSASNIIKDNKSKYYTASSKPENSVSEISEDKEKPGRSDRKSRLNGLNDIKKESAETKFNSKNTVSPVKDADQNLNSLSLSPAAKPFEPEKTFLPKSVELLQLSKLPLPTDMPVMVATSVEPSRLESVTSNLHEEYQPQDEYNICSYYKKNRFCWKPSCTKLHKEPTNKEPEITSIQTEQTELNSHPIKPELSQGDQLVKHEQANSSPQQPTTWDTFFLGDQLVKHELANSSPQHPTIHETFSLGDQLVKHEKANSSPQQPTTWETFFLGDPQANSSPQQPTIQETFSPGDQLVKHEKANSSPQQPSIGETFPQGKQLKSERLNSNPANRTFKNSPRQNMGNDSNICRFFRENSYCWNPACTKLHKLDRNNIHPPSNKNFSQRYPLIPPAQWYNDASTCTTFAANGFCWDPSCKKIHPRSSGH